MVKTKNLADETFETKVANFRNLLLKVKEIIDGENLNCLLDYDTILIGTLIHCRFI